MDIDSAADPLFCSRNKKMKNDLKEYENFCCSNGSFMQSIRWAKIKQTWQAKYLISKDRSGKIKGVMLVLVKQFPQFHTAFLYAPRGPVCNMHDQKTLSDLINQAKELAMRYHAYMLKIDPLIDEHDKEAIAILKALGLYHHSDRVGYDNIQCRENYQLDIKGKSAEEVLNHFKPKCRYNIRLAQRKGVRCRFYGEEKLGDFMKMMKETAERDRFDCRDSEYFKRILRAYGDRARLCMCYLGDVPLSGALCIEYNGTMSYVYGCSSNQYRSYMPNYLMQYRMIERAAEHRLKTYDFCGIPYWYDEKHPNYGVYRFKQNFCGYVKTYAGEFDYRFKPALCRMHDIFWKIKTRFL